MPLTGVAFFMAALAIVGMPPFSLFQSEFLMVSAAFGGGHTTAGLLFILFGAGVFAGIVLHVNRLVLGAAGEGRASWNPWCDLGRAGFHGRAGSDGLLAAGTAAGTDSRRGARGGGGLMSELFEELCEKFPAFPGIDDSVRGQVTIALHRSRHPPHRRPPARRLWLTPGGGLRRGPDAR